MENFDVNNLQGKWFEIARYPINGEKNCYNVTTEYYTKDDHLQVVNSCDVFIDGKLITFKRHGKVNFSKKLSVFTIIFDNPASYEDNNYIIITNYNYNYCIIGSKDKSKLWISHRRKQIDPEDYNTLLLKCSKLGYDITKLEISRSI